MDQALKNNFRWHKYLNYCKSSCEFRVTLKTLQPTLHDITVAPRNSQAHAPMTTWK